MKVRIKLANPFKRIDVLILEVFGLGNKQINDKLDKLQDDVSIIKSILVVDGPPSGDLGAAIQEQTQRLAASESDLAKAVEANQP